MRRLRLAIHLIALTACLATQMLPERETMPGMRRAIEAIADPSKFVRSTVERAGLGG